MTDDELEAANLKYHAPRVVALTSGRFAVFGVYTGEALPLVAIVEADSLRTTIEQAQRIPKANSKLIQAKQLLEELGL